MPSTIVYTGASLTTPQLDTVTVGSHTTGHTFPVTVNGKTYTYVAVAGDTTNVIAAASIATFLTAVTELEPEFGELTFTAAAAAATIAVTGPADGTPFTLTVGGGTGTISTAGTTTPASPNDLSLAANYSGGALPGAGDTLVFQGTGVSVLWNLAALAGVALAAVVRRASYTGQIGLPDSNPAGYREYRATHLKLDVAAVTWEVGDRDQAGQFRVWPFNTACTWTAAPGGTGPVAAPGDLGAEALELKGFAAASVLDAVGASITVCPLTGQTATLATVLATDCTLTLGSGVTLTAATLQGGAAEVQCSWSGTLTVGDRAAVTVTKAAAGTTTVLNSGTVTWRSTGGVGAVSINSDGTLDLNSAPAVVTAGTVTLYSGFTLLDDHKRLPAATVIVTSNCGIEEGTLRLGANRTYTTS